MRVVRTPPYEKRVRKLLTSDEQTRAEAEIVSDPEAWPVIAGTSGARKARARRGGRGKSGGARIVFVHQARKGVIYLIAIYAKNTKEDLTYDDKKEIRRFIAALGSQA